MSHKSGFTLAEALIVLGVIGVVSALTIPNLITKYQKRTAITRLKYSYSILNQAIRLYQTDSETDFFDLDTQQTSKKFFQTYINPYVKIAQECQPLSVCYGDIEPVAIDKTTKLNTNSYAIRLMNGMFLWGIQTHGGMLFYIDINGSGSPNRSGRDIFNWYYINKDSLGTHTGCQRQIDSLKSGLYPGGYASCFIPFSEYSRDELLGKTVHRTCNYDALRVSSTGGDACAAVIVKDNWEIKDDYPWD